MAYASFADYTDVYLGNSIREEDWARLAQRAGEHIDRMTQGRAADVTDAALLKALQMACCAAAEAVQQCEQVQAYAAVSSERVGDHSVTYAHMTVSERRQHVANAIAQHLVSTGLLHAGVPVKC